MFPKYRLELRGRLWASYMNHAVSAFPQRLLVPVPLLSCSVPDKVNNMSLERNSSDSSGVVVSAQIGSNGRLQSARYYAYQHRQQQQHAKLLPSDQGSPPRYGATSTTGSGGRQSNDPILPTSRRIVGNDRSTDEFIILEKPCVVLFLIFICAMFFTGVLYLIGLNIEGRDPSSYPQPLLPDERERYRNSGIYWGPERKLDCLDSYHFRQYTAQLQNISIDKGFNPTKACQSLPFEINGHTFEIPDQCRQVGVRMYGYWNVYDSSDCTMEDEIQRYRKAGIYWGTAEPAKHCHSFDKREYEAQLFNIPRGYNWNKACHYVPIIIQDQKIEKPDSCELRDQGVYGKWFVSNQLDCKPYWGPIREKGCQASSRKRYEAELWNLVPGDDWHVMCFSSPTRINGRDYAHPTTCDNRGPKRGGMVGVWDIESC